jgi:hypothetical protein
MSKQSVDPRNNVGILHFEGSRENSIRSRESRSCSRLLVIHTPNCDDKDEGPGAIRSLEPVGQNSMALTITTHGIIRDHVIDFLGVRGI